ncbi:Sensor protein kinase WalK [compost metagenome]
MNSIINDFQIAYPDISIAKELDTQKISLNLDKFHLTTAITNVLENAVKYGCKNIAVKASLLNNEFSISISDDGIGISKSKHSLLFDKFYRVEQGDLHDAKGLGLGLYYVDQIIKAHQGTINVVSDLGKGATFDLRFLI